MDESLDTGNAKANESMWNGLLGKIADSAAKRLDKEINPPKVDVSPVPNTAIVQLPAVGFQVDQKTVILVAAAIGAFLLYKHFSK